MCLPGSHFTCVLDLRLMVNCPNPELRLRVVWAGGAQDYSSKLMALDTCARQGQETIFCSHRARGQRAGNAAAHLLVLQMEISPSIISKQRKEESPAHAKQLPTDTTNTLKGGLIFLAVPVGH